MKASAQSRVFISYSHRGNGLEWKAWLLRHLGVFEQHHLLDVWQDGKIRVSSYWDDDITQAMSGARLAVILLTPEALQSQYILEKEFPFLRERQQRDKLAVFPVVCEPCDWKAHDWLRATQAPNESNPISPLTEAEQDCIFRQLATDVATELSRVALAELPKSEQPPPADHIYLEKFPLTRGPGLREERLIGREQELTLLDLAFVQPHTAIVSLVAWGGVGKTMLVQYWLQRLQREGWYGAQHVYAWSFYSQGTKEDRQASEDTFLAHALEWFGVQCEPTLSPWDKGRLLADAVARERTLLILDGIEPLQYPPGPMGGQLRAPGVQSLLKHLARKANTGQRGLCLVTTREPLTDLADFQRREGSPWGSVLRVDLGNLTDEAGAALLHHAGATRAGAAEIKPDDKELLAASREVDGHALTLNLLGCFLARAHGGDIRRRDLVKFEDADRKEQGGTTFRMLAAFENWFTNEGDIETRALTVLRLLGLFDRPVDAGCMGALRKPPVIAGLTEPLFALKRESTTGQTTEQPLSDKAWNDAIYFLAGFDLVVIQADADDRERLLECHPLIREYFAKHQQDRSPESWSSCHRRLYAHLCATTADKPQPTLEDLQPLYQAVAHGCQAGLQQEACHEVYFGRIRGATDPVYGFYSTRRLGAFSSDLAAVACFFEVPWSRVSRALTEADQAWLLNGAASYLQALGRLTEAFEPMQAGLLMDLKREDWENAAISAKHLSEMELMLGEVPGGVADAEQSVAYADRSGSAFRQMDLRATHADALHQAGRLAEARVRFREAEHLVMQVAYRPLLHSVPGFLYCDLLLTEAERAAWHVLLDSKTEIANPQLNDACRAVEERAATILDWDSMYGRLLDLGLHHLILGRAGLYRAILEEPAIRNHGVWDFDPRLQSKIELAVSGLRRAGHQDYLPLSLLTRAWSRYLSGDCTGPSSAQADLDEAWEIAERGPMRLFMADIHLYRVRLFGPRSKTEMYPWESPQADLAVAEKLINDCGYHRRDEELADAKRAILGA